MLDFLSFFTGETTFLDFLFTSLHTKHPLKKSLLLKERNCSQSKSVLFQYPFSESKGETTPDGSINPYSGKNIYTLESNFYGSIMKQSYDFAQLRTSNIYKRGISKPYWYILSPLQNLSWCLIVYM